MEASTTITSMDGGVLVSLRDCFTRPSYPLGTAVTARPEVGQTSVTQHTSVPVACGDDDAITVNHYVDITVPRHPFGSMRSHLFAQLVDCLAVEEDYLTLGVIVFSSAIGDQVVKNFAADTALLSSDFGMGCESRNHVFPLAVP